MIAALLLPLFPSTLFHIRHPLIAGFNMSIASFALTVLGIFAGWNNRFDRSGLSPRRRIR